MLKLDLESELDLQGAVVELEFVDGHPIGLGVAAVALGGMETELCSPPPPELELGGGHSTRPRAAVLDPGDVAAESSSSPPLDFSLEETTRSIWE